MEALGGLFVIAIGVAAIVLLVLAILMPVFIYQISQSTKETLNELKTLNTNVGRFLATQRPALPTPSAPTPPKIPAPSIQNLDEAAKFYGVNSR